MTTGEYQLLLAFCEQAGRILNRDQLLQRTHHRDAGPFDRTIDVQIGRLRRKLGDDGKEPRIIKSVRGAGYVPFGSRFSRRRPMIDAVAPDNDAFRLLFDAAPDAILVVDSAGRIRLNNAEAERMLDAAPGELRGLNVDKLVPISSRKRHAALRSSFALAPNRRPMGVGLSLKALKLNGREFPVEISLAPTQTARGVETIVMLRDVSDRLQARRTERELIRANALARISRLAARSASLMFSASVR